MQLTTHTYTSHPNQNMMNQETEEMMDKLNAEYFGG